MANATISIIGRTTNTNSFAMALRNLEDNGYIEHDRNSNTISLSHTGHFLLGQPPADSQ
jgi:hypothetical protein